MNSVQNVNDNRCSSVIAYAYLFWFFVVLDSFFIWNRFEGIIRVLAGGVVVLASLYYHRQKMLQLSVKDFTAFFFLLLYYLWLTVCMDDNIFKLIGRAAAFVPLLLVLFWPYEHLLDIYNRFRKIIVFFAIGSTIVSIIAFTGLLESLPYFVLDARSSLHERLGIEYHIYGLFLINHGALDFFRACGMLQEPGHFAIILGFVYMTDRLLGNRVSAWIVICGIFTFSSAFFLLVFVTEFFSITNRRKLYIAIASVLGFLALLGVIYLCLSSDIQDQIKYLAYERNLEDVASAGSLNDALNERTNVAGDEILKRINSSNIWTGLNVKDETVVLSDYRGVIVQTGLIGLFFLSVAGLFTTRGLSFRKKCPLLFFLFLVLIHRSWMYGSPYMFAMSYWATCSILASQTNEQSDAEPCQNVAEPCQSIAEPCN